MTYKKQQRFLVVSTGGGTPYFDFVRAADPKSAGDMVLLARVGTCRNDIFALSSDNLEKISQYLKTSRDIPDNAFDLLRHFAEIDDIEIDQLPEHIAAAKIGLPGKKLKTRETMFADSLWADEKTGKTRVVTLPVGARATVALRPDTSLGSSHPEGTFRIVFDLPVKDMYCNFYEVLNRFLPAGKKGWNL